MVLCLFLVSYARCNSIGVGEHWLNEPATLTALLEIFIFSNFLKTSTTSGRSLALSAEHHLPTVKSSLNISNETGSIATLLSIKSSRPFWLIKSFCKITWSYTGDIDSTIFSDQYRWFSPFVVSSHSRCDLEHDLKPILKLKTKEMWSLAESHTIPKL
jgi:hypothetical protein